MTSDERRESLADQAAAWVPPWQREPGPDPEVAPAAHPAAVGADAPAADAPIAEDAGFAEPVVVEAGAGERVDEGSAGTAAEEPAAGESVEPAVGEAVVGERVDEGSAGTAAEEPAAGESVEPAAGEPEFAELAMAVGVDSVVKEPVAGELEPADRAEAAGAWPMAEEAAGHGPTSADPVVEEPAAVADAAEREATLALIDDRELHAALEAIMLVVDEPIGETMLAQVLEQPTDRVAAALRALSASYTEGGHGFDLRRAAGGWRLYTRPEYASYVERFVLDGQQARLTQAALETLAVVAYKQPVTRSRISAIRGVNCDGVIRTLLGRGLVEECGTEPESGAHLYRTTTLFLEKLGLDSVEELPALAPFLPDDVEEIADAQR